MNLDVSQLLFPKVYYYEYVQSIDSTITSIILPNWTCNDINYTIFDFSRFIQVESIEIGDDSFSSVQTFKIDGLNRLKSLKIGKKSFTCSKVAKMDKTLNKSVITDCIISKSFHILNCESLESIQIDEYSFSDFGGDFELKNLPQLQSIQIGTIGNESYNFYSLLYNIKGIDMIMYICNV